MAQGGKSKRKIWFALSSGKVDDYVGVKVPSNWNPGKSKNKSFDNSRVFVKKNKSVIKKILYAKSGDVNAV